MTDRDLESGLELVLDNRKLIIAFAVVVAICGCFFVLGFVEGKRQGFQAGSLATAPSAPKASLDDAQAQITEPANSTPSSRLLKESAGQQGQDWYRSVNRRGGAPEGVRPPSGAGSIPKKPALGVSDKSKTQTAHSIQVTYSVQVGAFRQKRAAEVKAKELRAKGYDSRIDSPHPPEQLYLLKVGTFKSRADAVAMQLRLKKSGFPSLIKTN